MNKLYAYLTFSLVGTLLSVAPAAESTQKAKSEGPLPIIDMHVHARGKHGSYGRKDHLGNLAPANSDVFFEEVYGRFRKYNIVKAMVSGSIEDVDAWKAKDEDNRITRGILMGGGPPLMV